MKSCLQTGCLILGILCFVYYACIVGYAGLRTSLAWLWVFGGVFFLLLWRLLVWQGRQPRAVFRCAIALQLFLLFAGLLLIVLFGRRVLAGMYARPEPGLDYVVVLGAQVRGTAPSRALRRRLDRAAEYARENPETIFVLSGGQGPDEGISEAECMYRHLVRQGVARTRLLLENRSTSTQENLLYSAEYFDRKKDAVGILTNSFHVCRALTLAERQGCEHVCGIPAASDPLMQPHNILREICCLLAETLTGAI